MKQQVLRNERIRFVHKKITNTTGSLSTNEKLDILTIEQNLVVFVSFQICQ